MRNWHWHQQSGEPCLPVPHYLGIQLARVLKRATVCLECGANQDWLSKSHLALHGMDGETYRAKWEIDPSVSFEP